MDPLSGASPSLIVQGRVHWEVIRVFNGVEGRGEEALQQTAELTGLAPQRVTTAVRYYAEYQDEVDAWMRRVDEEAAQEAPTAFL